MGRPSPSGFVQRLIEILDDVVDVFDADREPNHLRRDANAQTGGFKALVDSLRADPPGYNPSRAFFIPSPRFIQAARTIIRSQPIQKSRTPRSM